MIRAPWAKQEYWDRCANYSVENVFKDLEQIKKPSNNPGCRPQFIWDLVTGRFSSFHPPTLFPR